MSTFFSWLKNNLSTFFSIIGIVLTLYLSIFYVPDYFQDLEIKKIESIHNSLLDTIQELVYNGHDVDQHDIDSLIAGKELAENIKYPYTVNQVLIQVQNKFIGNKFIPLEERKILFEVIDVIRENLAIEYIPEIDKKDEIPWYKDSELIFGGLLSMLGLIFGGLGIYSTSFKIKLSKDALYEENISNNAEKIRSDILAQISISNLIYSILKEYKNTNNKIDIIEEGKSDYLLQLDDNKLAIEVKYTDLELIPARTIVRMSRVANAYSCPVLLIANGKLTATSKKHFDLHNNKNDLNKIYLLDYSELSPDDVRAELAGILKEKGFDTN